MSFDIISYLHHNNVSPAHLGLDYTAYSILKEYILFINQEKFKKESNSKVWPTVDKIAHLVGCSTRTVKRKLQILKKDGFISYQRSNGNHYIYEIAVDKIVRNLKELLNLGDTQSPYVTKNSKKLGDSVSFSEIDTNLDNQININIYNNTRRPTENEQNASNPKPVGYNLKPTDKPVSPSSHLFNKSSNVKFCNLLKPEEGEFYSTGEIAHKLNLGHEVINMDETDMKNYVRFHAKEIRDKLIKLRSDFGLTFSEPEILELDLIASRILKLHERKLTWERCVSICHAVLDSRYHAIKKIKDPDYRDNQLNFFTLRLLFVNEKTFNINRSSLKNDSFIPPKTDNVIKLEDHKKKLEWEENKKNDIEYIELVEHAKKAERDWLSEPSNYGKINLFHAAQAKVEGYERVFFLKRSNA